MEIKKPVMHSKSVRNGVWEVFEDPSEKCASDLGLPGEKGLSRLETAYRANLIFYKDPESGDYILSKNRYGKSGMCPKEGFAVFFGLAMEASERAIKINETGEARAKEEKQLIEQARQWMREFHCQNDEQVETLLGVAQSALPQIAERARCWKRELDELKKKEAK